MPDPVLLFLDQRMARPIAQPMLRGQAAVFSARCPGKDTPNEDALALVPLPPVSAAMILADGMGGGRAGEAASRATVEIIAAALAPLEELAAQRQMEESTLRAAVLNGIEQANAQVKSQANGSATTLVVVAIHDGAARSFHVGDSLAMLIGGRGRVKLATVPHSPVGLGVEAGLLDAADAMHHEDRHLVLNMLGSDAMRIEMSSPIALAARDRLLLASDGLTDNLTDAQIIEVIRTGQPTTAAERLAEAALQRMTQPQTGQPSKPDDLSFILFHPARRPSEYQPRDTV
jgi:serine/threonine protein phosphatase PrpC